MWSLRLCVLSSLLLGGWTQTDNDIMKPPKVKVPAYSRTEYGLNQAELVVKCQAEGMPPPIYRWRRDEQVITDSTRIKYNSNTGDLTFTKLSISDEGTYMCEAMNKYNAASFSPEIKILVTRVTRFSNSKELETVVGTQYNYQALSCKYDGSAVGNLITFKWYLGSQTDELDSDNGRIYIDTEGNLHFTYLKLDDAKGSTHSYRCGLKAIELDTIVLGPMSALQVTKQTAHTATAPVLSYSNSGLQARLYSTAILECFFSGYSPSVANELPTIKWQDMAYKDITTNKDKYEISHNGRRLTIRNLQVEDEGDYHCSGSNSVGTSNLKPISLDIISSPVWNKDGQPKNQVIPEGQNAVFRCDATSLHGEQPAQAPVWYVNGQKLTSSQTFRLSGDSKTLTIENVQKESHNLCVQCKVTNDFGSTWADACLTVMLPITIVKQPNPLRQVISYGDNVDLTVIATSDPAVKSLEYSWFFDNKTYGPLSPPAYPPAVTYNPNTKEAYINTSRLTREEYHTIEGVYDRIVKHDAETKVVRIEVILDDKAAAATAASEFDWWIIGLILSIICLIIVIALIIFLCYRKQQEGDYNVDKKENTAGYDPERELKQAHFDDFSPPAYIDVDYSDKKPPGQAEMEYDDVPIGGDDESLGEYGEEDLKYFNDDGSFIGEYQKPQPPRRSYATESTI